MGRFLLIVAAAGCTLLPCRSTVSAQGVLVTVTEPESGAPVAGVFLTLLDEEGRPLRQALSNPGGRFLFPAPGPGRYRVKAEMIGRQTQISAPFDLVAGQAGRVELALPVHAIALQEIRVEADERCHLRPDEASEIGRVWEEARKALAVQAWTEGEGLYRFDVSTWERDLDGRGRRVETESRQDVAGATRPPFASLPTEELLRTGFVVPVEDGGHQYYGPDAQVLLSDAFLDSHCFRLTRSSDRPGSIGLALEPADAGGLPDIAGTLWLNEVSAELELLEYRYTWAPWPEARGLAGGRVEFEAMPNGAWIIDRWWIRAPLMGRRPDMVRAGDSGIRVAGIRETGGEVVGVSMPGRDRIAGAARGGLRGVVWDSTRSEPLEGASVYLSGTVYTAETDARGRFLLEGLPAGVFTAAFRHPRLDSLGILVPGTEVEVVPGEASEVTLAVPSQGAILLAACRAEEREEGAAVLSGLVRDRTSGAPIPGATVRLEWQDVQRTEPVVQATDRFFEVRTDARGRYTACGVPLDEAVHVQASFLQSRGDVMEVGFDVEESRTLDLDIELAAGLLSSRTEVRTGPVEVMGAQGVQGVLLDPQSGDPIRSAEVSLRDAAGRIRVSGVTNDHGFFRLQAPQAGTYLFSSTALGYSGVEARAVDVAPGKLTVLEVEMAPAALELEPLVATAEARSFHLEMQGFYERESRGLGIFMTPELLEERRLRKVTDLFSGMPGANVAEPALGAGGRAVYFRSGIRPGGGGAP
ncbi:MAG TPA: carboxypeptidase regulatory-like domain-containing protein, partial [Longimicrobiales bacterium]|nr:carboxypeptidase regulatory-like domain-containing protein [Longimicrobiales bacterium]